MKPAALSLLAATLLACAPAQAQSQHRCAAPAIQQAKKLFAFHYGEPVQASIDGKVKTLPPLKNPVGRDSYDVLEVTAYIQKATYRMRFIYGQIPGDCLLVGEEVLELTRL